jgi:uncharacterized membrane protein
VKLIVVLFCLSLPLVSGVVLPMLSLSTLWFVVVFTLVIFLWIPYQDMADKEEKTHNEEAAPEEEPREETNTTPQNDQGANTLNVGGGDRNNGVGRENDRGANIRQVDLGAAIGLVFCVAVALVTVVEVFMVAWRHSWEHLTDKENKQQQQESTSRANGPTAAFLVKEIPLKQRAWGTKEALPRFIVAFATVLDKKTYNCDIPEE